MLENLVFKAFFHKIILDASPKEVIEMVVMKFGGSAVKDAEAMKRVITVARRQAQEGPSPVVVISALAQVTNQLTEVAELVQEGARVVAYEILDTLTKRHNSMAKSLKLRAKADEFEELKSVEPEGNFPRFMDRILAAGELASSRMFVEALCRAGVPAQWVDARFVIVTDGEHGKAAPDYDTTRERARTMLLPIVMQGIVPVIGGFIGATRDGVTTTLGREGSDYTATLLGACLGAGEVQKWTDVDGIMTSNPRHDPTAHTRERMTFAEADQFAKSAKMIHAQTIEPLLKARTTRLVIRNINNPDNPGTVIGYGE